jgi:glycerophosphoryl diester phosphodiesterase
MQQKLQKSFLIAVTTVLFGACSQETLTIRNLNHNEIIACGHGGMGIESIYPMNSKGSAQKLFESGANAIEIDIQLSKDNQLIAFHDIDLSNQTDFTGFISDYTASEIENMDYKKNPFSSEKIISLDNYFNNIPWDSSTHFTFDLKLCTNSDQTTYFKNFVIALDSFIAKKHILSNLHIESQDTTFLKLIKKQIPGSQLFIYPTNFEAGLAAAISLDLFGITIAHYNITKEQIELAHQSGFRVAVWNTHSQKDNTDAINKSPDIIQTDEIKDLLDKLSP